VDELVNRLRKEVGQDSSSILENGDSSSYSSEMPDWFRTQNIVDLLDVRPMLERGEHPVHEVLQKLKTLETDMILEVISSFLPAPLIDKATSLGYKNWVPRVVIACRTRRWVASLTSSGWLRTLETVPTDTPADAATSLIPTVRLAITGFNHGGRPATGRRPLARWSELF
jgi:hypothetical protein